MDTEIEAWLPIKGYEGLYEISSLGRVKGLAKYGGMYRKVFIEERIMKLMFGLCTKTIGYYSITLSKDYTKKTFRIHRLVATHFINNPYNLKEVNHIDGNPKNNNVNNLEWCTRQQNTEHAWRIGLAKGFGVNHYKSKAVIQMNLSGDEIKKWDTQTMAKNGTGVPNTNISACCYGKVSTAGGFKWKFAV